MSTGNVRRGQLVAPFGVGSMQVLVNGVSVITGGLDHWYETSTGAGAAVDEFVVSDWRLEERLQVNQLRLPPDYRSEATSPENVRLTVPALRFPRWSFCIFCKRLEPFTLTLSRRPPCPDEAHASTQPARKGPLMSQVPFVAICERGHLDDFPWREWVHRSLAPTCQGVLRLQAYGGGSLSGQVVKCDLCEASRSLEGVTTVRQNGDSTLTATLAEGEQYVCGGARPWLGELNTSCGASLVAALRGAGNVYFPKIESSLFIPQAASGVRPEVLETLRRQDVQPTAQMLHEFNPPLTAEKLRSRASLDVVLREFSDDELNAGIAELFPPAGVDLGADSEEQSASQEDLTGNVAWRFPEYRLVRETPLHPDLTASDPGVPEALASRVSRVRRVEVLRETRALRGFTRYRDRPLRLSEGKELLRRRTLPRNLDWLPAYEVRGEGIYLEMDSGQVERWREMPGVATRAARLSLAYEHSRTRTGAGERAITPEFVAIHTLAHVVINELVFTCGYGSASLRERLYVSREPGREMLGVLVYTAAGDADGTMGGLARMARPENLGPVIMRALQRATWCSTDPVCMELGEAGQGPGSCNLAACHACALLPETSCEEFNQFLDRGLLVGTLERPELGLFPGGGTGLSAAG